MAGPNIYSALNATPDLTRRFKYVEIAIGLWLAVGTPTYTALANGGLLVDLTQMINVPKAPRGSFPNGPLPPSSDIEQYIMPAGYTALLLKNPTNPTLKNYILQIFNTFATELGNGSNIPAALFATTGPAANPFIFRVKYKNFR